VTCHQQVFSISAPEFYTIFTQTKKRKEKKEKAKKNKERIFCFTEYKRR